MATASRRLALAGFIRAITRYWALLGGLVLLGVVAVNVYSVALVIVLDRPFPGVYEIVQVGAAVGMFMFLPYCQITASNVTVDIFTEGMSERGKQAMAAFSSLFAIAFSVLLLVQMSSGFRSYLRYVEVTPVLKLPLWTAFPPILFSLLLLLCAAVITLVASWRAVRGPQDGAAEK